HAVVDFRGAPSPAQLLANQLPPGAAAALGLPGAAGSAGPSSTAAPTSTGGLSGLPGIPATDATVSPPCPGCAPNQKPPNAPAGSTVDGDFAYLMPSPAGRIVYFRIE